MQPSTLRNPVSFPRRGHARRSALAAATALLVAAVLVAPWSAARADDDADAPDGAALWSRHCGQCHNKRSPEKFSDSQWEVVVQHMRVRANLTGKEAAAILDFLKSAN